MFQIFIFSQIFRDFQIFVSQFSYFQHTKIIIWKNVKTYENRLRIFRISSNNHLSSHECLNDEDFLVDSLILGGFYICSWFFYFKILINFLPFWWFWEKKLDVALWEKICIIKMCNEMCHKNTSHDIITIFDIY